MTLVYSQQNGLVVAENACGEPEVAARLRQFDRQLVLTWEVDEHHQARVWRVFKRMGSDRPAVWICDWRDDYGNPLPLSSRLVDRVRDLSMNSRAPKPDAETHNQRLREEADKQFQEETGDIAKWHGGRHGRLACLPRGVSLRIARDKRRAQGENC